MNIDTEYPHQKFLDGLQDNFMDEVLKIHNDQAHYSDTPNDIHQQPPNAAPSQHAASQHAPGPATSRKQPADGIGGSLASSLPIPASSEPSKLQIVPETGRGSEAEQSLKRQTVPRIREACLPCQKAHRKCDGMLPCKECNKKGKNCRYKNGKPNPLSGQPLPPASVNEGDAIQLFIPQPLSNVGIDEEVYDQPAGDLVGSDYGAIETKPFRDLGQLFRKVLRKRILRKILAGPRQHAQHQEETRVGDNGNTSKQGDEGSSRSKQGRIRSIVGRMSGLQN
ncbi:hypothetical protein BC938DRAFT_472052 [Jimgerdemannia flammicorona]|uniref:Zn(2)-C6 fungal-type domain-containing protein n=1 Tax=Jimgerdemannia flammicorona TaxID=994334 RepID=A0A433QU81_9FUNG|nr:hypothetical protein BC938DRAFT_472052 [Jimgerdemannia flammicorona]